MSFALAQSCSELSDAVPPAPDNAGRDAGKPAHDRLGKQIILDVRFVLVQTTI